MSRAVRRGRRCSSLCYHNAGQARQGLDTERCRRLRDRLPGWLIPTHYYRSDCCGRWHLGYETATQPRPALPDLTARTAA